MGVRGGDWAVGVRGGDWATVRGRVGVRDVD